MIIMINIKQNNKQNITNNNGNNNKDPHRGQPGRCEHGAGRQRFLPRVLMVRGFNSGHVKPVDGDQILTITHL